jgi:hypothetical protein
MFHKERRLKGGCRQDCLPHDMEIVAAREQTDG